MTATSPSTSVDGRELIDDLRAQLATVLPGLCNDDLHSLAARTSSELENRVGDTLSKCLTDAQLTEFEQLIDRADDAQCARWLEITIPTYKATAAIVRAKLIAEIVETVATADPAAAIGNRGFAEVVTTSLDLVEEHCRTHEIRYTRDEDTVRFAHAATDSLPAVAISVRLLAGGHLLAVTGAASEVTYPAEVRDALTDFACKWNHDTWLPKASVAAVSEPDQWRLTGEMATPLPRRVTRSHLDTFISQAVTAMVTFFRETQEWQIS